MKKNKRIANTLLGAVLCFLAPCTYADIDIIDSAEVTFSLSKSQPYQCKKGLLKQGDEMEALIVLPMKNPIPCTMNVKHISQNSQFKDFEFAGIQFSKISEINKNKLSATVMDIYREFFLTATS